MGERSAEFLKQVRGIWARLEGGQKLTVASVLLVSVLGISAMVWFAGRPDFAVVFVAEHGDELTSAERSLVDAGIAYTVEGTRIRVDRARIDEARSALRRGGAAESGLVEDFAPLSGFGFDTETRRDYWHEVKLGQTAGKLRALDGVRTATLSVDRPQRSPFVLREAETHTSAAVVVELEHRADFEAIALAAIPIVSAAFGIREEDVAVIDARTKRQLRGGEVSNRSLVSAGDFMETQALIARRKTDDAADYLGRVYGDRAHVAVEVELDPEWERTREKIQPDRPILVDEERTETRSGGDAAFGDPNDPVQAAVRSAQVIDASRKKRYQTDFGDKETGLLAPRIRRISVAVTIDRSLEEQRDDIEACVAQIVGLDRARGDTIAINVSPLLPNAVTAPPESGAAGAGWLAWLSGLIEPLAQALVVAIVALVLWRAMRRPVQRTAARPPAPAEAERTILGARQDIETRIAADPVNVSRVLEAWLNEQKAT